MKCFGKRVRFVKEKFAEFSNQYVLIGGTACAVAFKEAEITFRATKDFDIVLCIEVLNKDFGEALWDFIKKGQYSNRQHSTGKNIFYRFHHLKTKIIPI